MSKVGDDFRAIIKAVSDRKVRKDLGFILEPLVGVLDMENRGAPGTADVALPAGVELAERCVEIGHARTVAAVTALQTVGLAYTAKHPSQPAETTDGARLTAANVIGGMLDVYVADSPTA